jgi:AraC-like DNA-binding protein
MIKHRHAANQPLRQPVNDEKARYFSADFFPEDGIPLRVDRNASQLEHMFHDHDFTELVLVTQGRGWHATRTDEHMIQTGDAFVIHPWEKHSYRDTSGLTLYNVMFDMPRLHLPMLDLERHPGYRALFALEPRLRTSHGFKSRLKLSPAHLAVVANQLNELQRELAEQRPGYQGMAVALFLQIMGYLSRCYAHIEDPRPRTLLRLGVVLDQLESSLGQPVRLEELARRAGMSRSSLQRAFRRTLDASPVDYWIRLRIQKACELLAGGNVRIKEAAMATGFDDSNYFTRQFRRIQGVCPREYVRSVLRAPQDVRAPVDRPS